MFFILGNQRGILSYKIRQLPCRPRGARAQHLVSHPPFRLDSFVHGNVFFFFPLIDRLVCTIQSNQTLDALIKYVAYYFRSILWPIRNSFKCTCTIQAGIFYVLHPLCCFLDTLLHPYAFISLVNVKCSCKYVLLFFATCRRSIRPFRQFRVGSTLMCCVCYTWLLQTVPGWEYCYVLCLLHVALST